MSLRSDGASHISSGAGRLTGAMQRAAAHVALSLALAAGTSLHADDVLDYLDARGLDTLAALRIEELARDAAPAEKAQLLDRLAELYSRMLDETTDPAAQARLLGRGDELADRIQTAKGDALRVAAARARYRTAARVAENVRAGLPGDVDGAVALLSQQIDTLLEVSARAEKRANDIERRIDGDRAVEAESLQTAKEREQALSGVARYLAAWSLVYRGFLRDDSRDSERAASIFIPILGGRDGKLVPDDVSEPLRADELFASSILGLALAKAPTAGFTEAMRWIALLDFEETAASVRDAREGWSMVAALEARAFKSAREILARLAVREDAGNWARVAASRAVERGVASGGDAEASQLLREAVALLAAKRELSAVRDLVQKYGEPILGEDSSGFVPRYVRAVRLYDEAQQAILSAGADQERLASDAVRGPAAEAAAALGSALEAADASKFTEALAACRLMRAWSLRGAGRYMEAAQEFESVSSDAVGDRAEEAARLAVLSLDDARRATKVLAERKAIDEDLVKKVDAFLSRFPGSDHVPEMLVRKVAALAEPSSADVGQLLRIKPDSKDWLVSRRQALEGLYRTFRAGKEPRDETGRRYVSVLAELPPDPATGLPSGSSAIARQALEVLLANEVRATQMAAQLIESLEKAAAQGTFDMREADEEISYRRLQLAMLSERWADVEAQLAPFEKPEAAKLWADAALRLSIRGAESRRRSSLADAPERGAFVATILRAGDAIFARADGYEKAFDSANPDAPALLQIAVVLLDARAELVRSNGDRDEAARGLELADVLLARRPNDGALLRAGAQLAEAAGNYERASDLLRALVGGLPARTEPWFVAKVDQMRVLAKLSPERARAVIAQYRALYPDLGPEPHRARILDIERSLPPERPAPAGDVGGSTGGAP
jgi:hypothetical protein